MAYPPVADAAILNSGMFWDACCAEGYHISHETLATGLRASIYSDSRLALPPTAAVLMLTLCSIAKRVR